VRPLIFCGRFFFFPAGIITNILKVTENSKKRKKMSKKKKKRKWKNRYPNFELFIYVFSKGKRGGLLPCLSRSPASSTRIHASNF
jgi:hypothetical protein